MLSDYQLNHLKFTYNKSLEYIKLLSIIKKNTNKIILIDCATNYLITRSCTGLKNSIVISPDGKLSMCAFCDIWIQIKDSLKDSIDNFNNHHYTGQCECLNKFILRDKIPQSTTIS